MNRRNGRAWNKLLRLDTDESIGRCRSTSRGIFPFEFKRELSIGGYGPIASSHATFIRSLEAWTRFSNGVEASSVLSDFTPKHFRECCTCAMKMNFDGTHRDLQDLRDLFIFEILRVPEFDHALVILR